MRNQFLSAILFALSGFLALLTPAYAGGDSLPESLPLVGDFFDDPIEEVSDVAETSNQPEVKLPKQEPKMKPKPAVEYVSAQSGDDFNLVPRNRGYTDMYAFFVGNDGARLYERYDQKGGGSKEMFVFEAFGEHWVWFRNGSRPYNLREVSLRSESPSCRVVEHRNSNLKDGEDFIVKTGCLEYDREVNYYDDSVCVHTETVNRKPGSGMKVRPLDLCVNAEGRLIAYRQDGTQYSAAYPAKRQPKVSTWSLTELVPGKVYRTQVYRPERRKRHRLGEVTSVICPRNGGSTQFYGYNPQEGMLMIINGERLILNRENTPHGNLIVARLSEFRKGTSCNEARHSVAYGNV
jgi:hypothetical protein